MADMTTETTTELLPCPFCGGPGVLENYVIEAGAICPECHASIVHRHARYTDITALRSVAAAWNTRTPDSRLLAAHEALRKIMALLSFAGQDSVTQAAAESNRNSAWWQAKNALDALTGTGDDVLAAKIEAARPQETPETGGEDYVSPPLKTRPATAAIHAPSQAVPDGEGLIKRLRAKAAPAGPGLYTIYEEAADALTAANERAEKAERERDEALASEKLERNRANGWRSQAATIRAETVEACARIADQRSAPRDTWGDRYDEGAVACAEIIAEEIRALSPTAPMTQAAQQTQEDE
jgi:hypothetical protein